MSASAAAGPPIGSLAVTTIRRAFTVGRVYLILATALILFFTVITLVAGQGSSVFANTFPLELPIFVSMGAIGGLMTFTSDRTKGVFEYLIAYGVPPRSLFGGGLLSTATLTTTILGIALAVGLGGAVATGTPVTHSLLQSLVLYTIPMGYATAFLTATAGMIWTSISTPRTGMNSPIGFAPMLGVAPTVFVLIVAERAPAADFYYVTGGAALAIFVVVVLLLGLSARLMGRERFLSPI
ncbi:MAG: hypothetical protein WCB18_09920 [Thermoplasmata archaeon]